MPVQRQADGRCVSCTIKSKLTTMKKELLFVTFLFSLTALGQTKKETIDWLNSKFENCPIITSEVGSMARFLKINPDGSFSVQDYDYSPKVLLPTLENYRYKTLFTGHFKDLAPNSVTTKTIKGNIYFYASCSSGKCITQQNQGRDDFSTYQTPSILLGITSEPSLEERCKKAFVHLITLCGGKKEAF